MDAVSGGSIYDEAMQDEANELPPRNYVRRMWDLRHLLFSLVGMDLRARYKRSVLGIGWSLIRPIAMTIVLCAVFCPLFNQSIMDFAPFLLCGLSIWQFINESSMVGCYCFMLGAPYIRQQPLPLALFPLRTTLSTGFHASVSFSVAIGLICATRGIPPLHVFMMLIPTLIMLFILVWALVTFFGLLHTHFPDTHHLMEIFFQILFYLTPIMYPPEMIRARQRFAWLVEINPFSHVLDAIRHPLLTGELPGLHTYAIFAAFVCTMLFLSSLLLRKLERNLVFWV